MTSCWEQGLNWFFWSQSVLFVSHQCLRLLIFILAYKYECSACLIDLRPKQIQIQIQSPVVKLADVHLGILGPWVWLFETDIQLFDLVLKWKQIWSWNEINSIARYIFKKYTFNQIHFQKYTFEIHSLQKHVRVHTKNKLLQNTLSQNTPLKITLLKTTFWTIQLICSYTWYFSSLLLAFSSETSSCFWFSPMADNSSSIVTTWNITTESRCYLI